MGEGDLAAAQAQLCHVEAFGQIYKIDHALIIEETPVAFLEAKGVDTALTSEHDEQLASYMTNKNVNYGTLTNGERYRFFQRRVDASNVEVRKIGESELEDLPERITVLRAHTKAAIESGESEKILKRINELRNAQRTLEAEKDRLASELADVLADQVSDTVRSLAQSQSKELIDRLVEDIEQEIDVDGEGLSSDGRMGRFHRRQSKTHRRRATTSSGFETAKPSSKPLPTTIKAT